MLISRRRVLHGAGAGAVGLVGCRMNDPSAGASASASPLATTSAPPEARAVTRVIAASPTVEGAGVHLSRSIGSRALSMVDPFLLLDDIHSRDPRDYAPGFPRHPHRGFETVTYMIEGVIEHGDSLGNRGVLTAGSLQWMTAGRGIVHSEMPKTSGGPLWGLQLWVNLPKRLKMTSPRYQDIAPDRVPEIGGGAKTRVLAGARDGTRGPVEGVAAMPTMMDASIADGGSFVHELPPLHAAFVYVLSGVALVGADKRAVAERELAVLGEGTLAMVRASGAPCRVLLVAAAPMKEPVARRGPFVMNTEEELDKAYDDYRAGRLTDG